MKGISKEIEGLYYLPTQFLFQQEGLEDAKIFMRKTTDDSKGILWHNRMGHLSIKVLKQLSLIKTEC